MPKFKFGDEVERIDPIIPGYRHRGHITRVMLTTTGLEYLNEYEVTFEDRSTSRFYESEMRVVESDDVS